jgi:hypothetical protein
MANSCLLKGDSFFRSPWLSFLAAWACSSPRGIKLEELNNVMWINYFINEPIAALRVEV